MTAEGVPAIMNLTIVPYGNAQIDTSTKTVTCQHGESECEGNLWEQCAIDAYPDFNDHFWFYYCMEGYGTSMLDHVQDCATTASEQATQTIDYDVLSACFNDPDKAWELSQEFAALTPADHQYTPWVEVPTGTVIQYQATFLYEICAAYEGDLPAGCPQAQEKRCMKEGAVSK